MNIIKKIGVNYTMLGYLLLNDGDGSIVPTITSQHHLKALEINIDILSQWIRGKGKMPVTWKTLIDTLYTIELAELANTIEQGLSQPV